MTAKMELHDHEKYYTSRSRGTNVLKMTRIPLHAGCEGYGELQALSGFF